MKIKIKVIVSSVLFLLSPLSIALPSIQHWQTNNGVQVYFVPTEGLPILDAQLVLRAGSSADGDKNGVAALTSGLLTQGAAGLNAQDIAEQLDSVGAQLSASTSRDLTTISYRSLTDERALQTSWQLLKAVLSKPNFPLQDFNRIKARTLLGIKQRQESPGILAQLALYQRIYKDHPYSHAIQGVESTVKEIQVNDLKQFYQQYYVANNLAVVLVGGISREQAERMVEELVVDLLTGKKAAPIEAVFTPQKGKVIHLEYPSEQTHLLYGLPVLQHNDPDYFPLYVGNHILGGSGFSSRIVKEIREERGLAYSAYSYFHPMIQKGPFVMGLQTRNEKAKEASMAVKQTLRTFIQDGPTDEELVAAKKNIVGGFALKLDSNKKLLGNVVRIVVSGAPLNYLNSYMQKIEAVTQQQIKQAFQKRLKMEKMTMVTAGQSVAQKD